ncbi:pentapeptide repeat-containing protein [Helicobacter pylori]|uniref:pentapeptide repeat-containing protein n=1 Tax=Helicobacter pylori TaxID=210 RepID=UPI003CC8ACE1
MEDSYCCCQILLPYFPFKNSSFKNSSFKNSSFKNSSFKNSSFKNSSFKNSSFKNSSFKNSFSYENCTFQTFKSNHYTTNYNIKSPPFKMRFFYPFDLTKRAMRSIPFSICFSEHAKDKRT